jgi:hypothetical protein
MDAVRPDFRYGPEADITIGILIANVTEAL